MSQNSRRWAGAKSQKLVALCLDTYGPICHLCGRYVCPWCGKAGADSADHVVPRSRGGGDGLDNLRPAHRCCNYRRGDKPITSVPLDLGDPNKSGLNFFKHIAREAPALRH